MSDFNRPVHAKVWRPNVIKYPTHWVKVDPSTGVVLGEYSGVEKPRAPHPGVVIVPAVRK